MGEKGYAHPELLMTPEKVHARLADSSFRVVDARPTHAYVAGHIPGAISLDLYGLSLNDTGREAFEAFMWTLRYLLGSRGIGSDHTVVFYADDSGMRAARGFWICEYLGHKDVHVLDGGFLAWTKAGYPTTTACSVPERAEFRSESAPETHMGYEEIRDSLGQPGFVVLDVRSDDEYYGRVARSARGGAIPGAVHMEYVHNLDAEGRFKPAAELRAMYERAGVKPECTIACH